MNKIISIIVSVMNEEDNIAPLVENIVAQTSAIKNIDFSILFIDDGSSDQTLERIKNISNLYPQVNYVSFTRNYGHETAMKAGAELSSDKDACIFMDGDMQHPPVIIKEMVSKWMDGYPIVLTNRESNEENSKTYKFFSSIFYRTLNWLADFNIKKNSPDFRLIDKKYIKEINKFKESSSVFRFILYSFMPEKEIYTISFTAPLREFGESKYNYTKLISLAIDSLISFSTKPLRMALIGSTIMFSLSTIVGIYFLIEWALFGNSTPGFMTLLLAIISLGSANLFILSVLGEYVAKIHIEVKKRPLYTISEISI